MRRLSEFEKNLYSHAAGTPAPFCLVQTWPWWWRGFRGFTLGCLVLVKHNDDPVLICHELEHVRQFYAQPFTFWLRYLFALARVGYLRNPYEQGARFIAERARAALRSR